MLKIEGLEPVFSIQSKLDERANAGK